MACRDSRRIGFSHRLRFLLSHSLKRSRVRSSVVRVASRHSLRYSSSPRRSQCSRSIVAGRRECRLNPNLLLRHSRKGNHRRSRRRSGVARVSNRFSRNLLLKLSLNHSSLSLSSGAAHSSKLRLLRQYRRRSLSLSRSRLSHSSGAGHSSKLRLRRRSLSLSSGADRNSRSLNLNLRLLPLRNHGRNRNRRRPLRLLLRLGLSLNRSRDDLITKAEAMTGRTTEGTESRLSC